MTDHDDETELARLRREAERTAYVKGLAMLNDPQTPATARASVIRAFITDAAARQGNDAPFEPHSASPAQLAKAAEILMRRITTKSDDVIDVTPSVGPDIFR